MPTRPIRLLLADVDGTLVTSDKLLTDRAVQAVHKLHDAACPLRGDQRATTPRHVHDHRASGADH